MSYSAGIVLRYCSKQIVGDAGVEMLAGSALKDVDVLYRDALAQSYLFCREVVRVRSSYAGQPLVAGRAVWISQGERVRLR
jgi:hypothetical protein